MGCELGKLASSGDNKKDVDNAVNEPPAPSAPDPRLPLTARQKYSMVASWKGISRAMEPTGVNMFIKWVSWREIMCLGTELVRDAPKMGWSDKDMDFLTRLAFAAWVFINPLLKQPWLESSSSRNVTFPSELLDNLEFSSCNFQRPESLLSSVLVVVVVRCSRFGSLSRLFHFLRIFHPLCLKRLSSS